MSIPIFLLEKLSVKLKEEERMVQMFLEYKNGMWQTRSEFCVN